MQYSNYDSYFDMERAPDSPEILSAKMEDPVKMGDAVKMNDAVKTDDAVKTEDTVKMDDTVKEHTQYKPQSELTKIGWGSFGVVFGDDQGHALKRVINSTLTRAQRFWTLSDEHEAHVAILDAFRRTIPYGLTPRVKIPAVIDYILASDNEWWEANGNKFPEQWPGPCDVLVTEQVPALSPRLRREIVDSFCPEQIRVHSLQNDKSHCIAWLCLSKPHPHGLGGRPARLRVFSLQNFLLYKDRFEKLGFYPPAYAERIGQALALIHCVAKYNAQDVEFVLGGVTDNERHLRKHHEEAPCHCDEVQLYCIDFNQCKKIELDTEGIRSCVHAFYTKNRFYPRPSDEALWQAFKSGYVGQVQRLGDSKAAFFAQELFKAVVEEREKMEEKARLVEEGSWEACARRVDELREVVCGSIESEDRGSEERASQERIRQDRRRRLRRRVLAFVFLIISVVVVLFAFLHLGIILGKESEK